MAQLSHSLGIYSDGSIQEIVSPPAGGIPLPAGEFAQVLHDDEAMDDKQRLGMPEVYPLALSQPCIMTEAWQRYQYRLLMQGYRGTWDETKLTAAEVVTVKTAFKKVYKQSIAFCNFAGFDNAANYIAGTNLNLAPPKQEPLTCCGNVVKVLGPSERRAGVWVTPIETLRGDVPPPDIARINRLTHPWLVFAATNVAAFKPSPNPDTWQHIIVEGRWKVDPFPQLGGRDVLVPLRTNGREADTYQRDGVWYAANYIRSSRLVPVTGSVPSPYVP